MRLRYRFLHRSGALLWWLVTPASRPDSHGFTFCRRVDEFWRASS